MRGFSRAVALGIAVLAGTTGASLLAQQPPEDLRFEVASVKANTGSDLSINFHPELPDGFRVTNHPLESLIRSAYDVQPFRVMGMPSWAQDERFDIDARASTPITVDERRLMLRALLIDRFQLRARFEPREQTVYVLTRADAGRPLGRGLAPRADCTDKCSGGGSVYPGGGLAQVRGMSIDRLATGVLSSVLRQVVIDKTEVGGFYDLNLSWRPDAATDPNDARPSFLTAVEEQLGLKLTPTRGPVDVLVIDSVSRPTSN